MRAATFSRQLHLLVGCILLLMTSYSQGQDDDFDANVFMEKFGYLDDTPAGGSHSPDTVVNGVREFQRFHGLRVTGRLDRRTIRTMGMPRCGVPDVVKPGERPLQLRSENNPNAPLAYNAPGYKWNNNQVTYKWISHTSKVPRSEQMRAISNAFRKWSDVTPLRFTESRGDADILVSFGRRDHGDGRGNAFDGTSGTLAHAFFPGGPGIAGDTHFDDDENWSINSNSGTDLEIVAAHEFGHALGLGHSSVPQALMAPVYRGYDPNYGLHQDDINGVQSLYGQGRGGADPSRTTRRPLTTRRPRTTRRQRPTTRRPRVTQAPSGSNCDIRFHAIEQIEDGRVLVFVGRDVYTVTRQGIQNRMRTRRIFPRAPSNPGAVVYDRYRNYVYFFKGSRVWRYRNFRLDSGYPKSLPSAFRRAKGGMQWRDGAIYLFKGREYMKWSEGMTGHASGYPRRVNSFWQGMPSHISSIFRSRDGHAYAFKGRRYYRFDARARITSGYPKDMRPLWLNCPQSGSRNRGQQLTDNDYSFLTTVDEENTGRQTV